MLGAGSRTSFAARREATLAVLIGLLVIAAPASAALTPVDGDWRAEGAVGSWTQVVYFSTESAGRRLTATNGLIGSPIDPCSWAGRWSEPATVLIVAGRFDTGWQGASPVDPNRVRVHGEFTSPTTARVTFTISCARAGSGPATETFAFDATTNTPAPPVPRTCRSARVADGGLRLGGSLGAKTDLRSFRRGAAFAIKRAGLDCRELGAVMGALLPARDELGALGAAGYRVTRYSRLKVRGRRAYRVRARHGADAITYERFGAWRMDHSIYRAGQHIDIPADSSSHEECTGSFALAVPGLGNVGLTAAHCNSGPRAAPVERGFAGTDPERPPQLGVVLTPPGERPAKLDAAIFSILFKWGIAQQIERGDRPPLFVDGVLPTAEQRRGTTICFAGRSSGADQCGHVVKCPLVTRVRFRGVKCADVQARQGDSGGPVYLEPGLGLSTSAVGIVTGLVPRGFRLREILVYTPIEPILAALGATLPSGPTVR